MIHSLHIRNFKGIRRADVGLERLTVIVGPNASGKTSLLEAVHLLSQIGTISPQALFQGQRNPPLIHRRGAEGQVLELSCSVIESKVTIRLVPSELSSGPWKFLIGDGTMERDFTNPSRMQNEGLQKFREETAKGLRPADLLRLDAARMVDHLLGGGTRMSYDGAGLASALAFMALNQPDDFQQIQLRLRAVVPTIRRIRFDQVEVKAGGSDRLNAVFKLLFDFIGASDVPAHMASEGTILVLGLLTALMGRGRPDLILLDDLDRGLHPKAQREVVGLLRVILEQNPDLQIVATSHSPYLVDNLRPEEVRLTTLDDDGTVSIAGLVDHPDFEKWKDEMAPGEMWSLFGEKWVSEVNRIAGGE